MIEAGIECRDPFHAVIQHDGSMYCVSSRDSSPAANQVTRTIGIGQSHVENHRADFHEKLLDFAGHVQPAYRRVPIQDLLKNFSATAGLDFA